MSLYTYTKIRPFVLAGFYPLQNSHYPFPFLTLQKNDLTIALKHSEKY